MHYLNVAGIKLFRLIVPIAQKVLTPKQAAPPAPDATTYISSPSDASQCGVDSKHKGHLSTPSNGGSRRSASGAPSVKSHSPASAAEKQRLLKADIYLPTRTSEIGLAAPPPNTVLPIVINFHASGFCFQAHGEDAGFCSFLANSLPAVVIDVDYSHAPEHPWPAAVQDVDAAIAWARRFAKIGRKCRQKFGLTSGVGGGGDNEWEWDDRRIALTGFSAGGNLALVGSTRKEANGGVQAVVAYYPSTNLAESAWKKPQLAPGSHAAGGALPPWLRHMLYECYIPAEIAPDRKDPAISPLYAAPCSFPDSVTIISCEKDSLAREGAQLAERLQQASLNTIRTSNLTHRRSGVGGEEPSSDQRETATVDGAASTAEGAYRGDVTLWTAKGQGHNWDKMAAQGSEPAKMRDEAYRLTVRRIRDAFAKVAVGFDEMKDDEDDEHEHGDEWSERESI